MNHDGPSMESVPGSPPRDDAHDEAPVYPIRAESQRLPASRPCVVGSVQCRHGAAGRRTLPAAHRGYRCLPLPPRIRGGDLPGSRVARACVGGAGAAPVGAFAGLSAALDRLTALGLVYPSFESRAEIARAVAERERGGPWPRDPDGVPLYPGGAKALSARRTAAAAGGRRSVRAAPRRRRQR